MVAMSCAGWTVGRMTRACLCLVLIPATLESAVRGLGQAAFVAPGAVSRGLASPLWDGGRFDVWSRGASGRHRSGACCDSAPNCGDSGGIRCLRALREGYPPSRDFDESSRRSDSEDRWPPRSGGWRTGSMELQDAARGKRRVRQGSAGRAGTQTGNRIHSTGVHGQQGHRNADEGGIKHAKSGQAVEVMYGGDWRPAVVVGLTRYKEVVVQYVGGNEHCRETIDIRSDRMRPMKVKGSRTVLRTDVAKGRKSDLQMQLGWCAEIAAEAADKGRSTASVPLVASQSAIGWRQRREAENWFGSWTLPGREGERGERAVSVAQLPRDLASFRSLVSLLDALEAAIAASHSGFGAKQGVVAMNHIKRLTWQSQGDEALKGRLTETMRHFALAAAKGMDHLSSKDVALMLNAVTSVLDVKSDCPGLRSQSQHDEKEPSATSTTSPSAAAQGEGQTGDACVFRGLFDSASRRLLRLDTLYTAHVMAGVPDFDNPGKFTSQGVAMVANALAHAGVRDEALLAMLSRVIGFQLQPSEYTAQSASLIAAAFERLSFHDADVVARLADAAVAIPVRSFDGQALSSLLWSLSRRGELSRNTRLLRKTATVLEQMPLKKWNVQHLSRALQAVSSAYSQLPRPPLPQGDATGSTLACRREAGHGTPASSAAAAAEATLALEAVAKLLFGYASLNVGRGKLPLAGTVSPTALGVLAAECVWACEKGFLSVAQRDQVLDAVSRAVTALAAACVHAFSHRDVSVLLAAFSRARSWGWRPASEAPPATHEQGSRAAPASAVPSPSSSPSPSPSSSSPPPSSQAPGSPAGESGHGWQAPGRSAEREARPDAAKVAVCRRLVEVVRVLPLERAGAGDLVSLIMSMARAVEAGSLQGTDRELAVVAAVVRRVSGAAGVSPKLMVDAVVSAARCGVREADALGRLSAAAERCLAAESRGPPGRAGPEADEHLSVDDIGALVRAVAYLNIIDRQLLSAAAQVLLRRRRASKDRHAAAPAQAVANVAWAAAVMGGVDEHVHTWIGACLEDAECLATLSREQVRRGRDRERVCFSLF